MAPRRLVSHLSISSKWLPKVVIQIFKEYLRTKLQAPVVYPALGRRCADAACSVGSNYLTLIKIKLFQKFICLLDEMA